MEKVSTTIIDSIRAELNRLDGEMVRVDDRLLKPSQCYRIELDPVHILFNTNCPDDLRSKVQSILSKYIPGVEDRTQ
jgi:hypothetical protein